MSHPIFSPFTICKGVQENYSTPVPHGGRKIYMHLIGKTKHVMPTTNQLVTTAHTVMVLSPPFTPVTSTSCSTDSIELFEIHSMYGVKNLVKNHRHNALVDIVTSAE